MYMDVPENPLKEFFYKNTGNAIHKWVHYFDIYHRHFKKYRNRPVVILEIGVFQGGSLNMWRDYFGIEAELYAIDINPLCKQFESDGVKIFIGSQEDRDFLRKVKDQIPSIDILIDDGGHGMQQQIVSFEELYDHVKEDGLYLVEDLHTSYWKHYGGGYKNKHSFIEYSKHFIDLLHAWHAEDEKLKVNEFSTSCYALHYYDSVLVVEKGRILKPQSLLKGEIVIDIDAFSSGPINDLTKEKSFIRRLMAKLKAVFNLAVRAI